MNRTILILALGALGAHASAQTAVSSALNLGTLVDRDSAGSSYIGIYSFTQGGTIDPLAGGSSAIDWETDSAYIYAYSNGAALWNDSGSGSFTTDAGFETKDLSTGPFYNLNNVVTGLPVWRYTFDATSDGLFTLDYRVTSTGFSFGLQAWHLDFDGTSTMLGADPVYPDGAGSVSFSVVAGQTYTAALSNYANLYFDPSLPAPNLSGTMHGDFNWSITPVPEPGTFAALAMGAALLRSRRRNR